MKQVSFDEIRDIVNAIENADYSAEWREFIHKYYGPTAVKVELNIHSEYNDSGYSARVEDYFVYNASGDVLSPDFSLPEPESVINSYKEKKAQDLQKFAANARLKYPKLAESAIQQIAETEMETNSYYTDKKVVESNMNDEFYELSFPGQGECGDDYSNKIVLNISSEEIEIPKFYVEYSK